jgi:two-component system response regulator HydG
MTEPDTDSPKILVIDDEMSLVETISVLLEGEGFEVFTALSGQEGLEEFDENDPDLVLVDVRMPKMNGVEVLEEVRDRSPETPVVLITAQASLDSAIRAVNLGATHYVRKPFSNEELVAIIRRSLDWGEVQRENESLRTELARERDQDDGAPRPIGNSPAFLEALDMAESVADSDSTILLRGESGVGKEVFARHIHRLSARAGAGFHSLNCGALPEGLLESELFGHVEGSFTGAVKDKEGLFSAASGGTLLLDEVGEMSPATQVKLLRVLQQKEVVPVGSTETLQVDVRLIAATNRDLERDMEEGRFRSDLYYRLNVISIDIPPLRSRNDDIEVLARHFLQEEAGEGEEPRDLSEEVLEAFGEYRWPGNVRELENVIERAVVLCSGDTVELEHLPERITEPSSEPLVQERTPDNPSLETIERAYIEHVIRAEDGNKTRAAEVLGINPSTLYRKLKRYDIDL